MGIRKPRPVLAWMSTLGQMRAYETRVIHSCSRCGFYARVDLDVMIGLLGADGSLWDRRPPCEACDNMVTHFMASPGESTPYLPLKSWWAWSMDELPPEAWMGGWTGSETPPATPEPWPAR